MYLSLCHDAGDGVQRGMQVGMFFGWVGGGVGGVGGNVRYSEKSIFPQEMYDSTALNASIKDIPSV